MVRFLLWWNSQNVWKRRAIALALAIFSIGLLATGHSRLWFWIWCPAFCLFPFTNRTARPPFGSSALRDAMRQVYAAAGRLSWWRRNPSTALALLEPLHSLECPDPEVEDNFRFVKCMILATTGDCYYHLRKPLQAAHWYRQAAEFRKRGGFGYLYADLVLKYELKDDYALALDCIECANARWRSHSWLLRVVAYIISPWWLDPQGWRLRFTQHRFPRRLRERMAVLNQQPLAD